MASILSSTREHNSPNHWRLRAEGMRTLAEGTRDERTRAIMFKIAHDYDLLAERTSLMQIQIGDDE